MAIRITVLTSVHQPFDVRVFHRECRALAAAGYDVTLVAPAAFRREERDGITVLGVPKPRRRLGRPLVWWRLFQQARRLRPGVVHFHDPELLLLVPFLRLVLGRRCKLVYDVHEYFVDAVAVKHWIPRPLRPAVAFLARWMERLLVRGVDAVVFAVEGQRPLYGYFRGPTAVVRNLPAAVLFADPQSHPALDVAGLRLIYVGLIMPQRGTDVLLEAMRLLHDQGVHDVVLFLIGPETSAAYMRQIESFCREHGLAEQVRWLGPVPPDRLKHYLANADVGVATGLYTAQYSRPSIFTKLFEYMLAGLPVLSADYPWSRVFVEESACGLLVRGDDAAAYADAIRWLRDHRDEAGAMGQRGREMVLDHYTWEQEQDRLLALYRELLRSKIVGHR
jgi:glycosyltransferase involved in cell wall biosynthesis